MKKNHFKLLCLLIAVLFLINISIISAFGYAVKTPEFPEKQVSYKSAKDISFDDFTTYEENDYPIGIGSSLGTGVSLGVGIEKTPDYQNKNVLKLIDESSDGAGYFSIKIPDTENAYTLVTRFKFKKTSSAILPFRFEGRGSGQQAFFLEWSLSEYIKYRITAPSTNKYLTNKIHFEPDVWYTLKIRPDFNKRTTAISIQGDTFKKEGVTTLEPVKINRNTGTIFVDGLEWNNTYTLPKIEEMRFNLFGNTDKGEFHFDYIRIEGDSEPIEFEKVVYPKISIEKIASPVERRFSDKINLKVNGEYFRPSSNLYIMNDLIMIKANDFARLNGLGCIITADDIIMKDGLNEITINIGTNIAKVNNEIVSFTMNIGKDAYIPLDEIAKKMNFTVNYSAESNTVEITK